MFEFELYECLENKILCWIHLHVSIKKFYHSHDTLYAFKMIRTASQLIIKALQLTIVSLCSIFIP